VRTDLYLKIELDLPDTEQPEKLAAEICRQVSKIYGVRSAEVQNMVEQG
jgi:DNA gyrase inhibitor GyrI